MVKLKVIALKNRLREHRLRLSSLSVYRGILEEPVPAALLRLLDSREADASLFLHEWGGLFAALTRTGNGNVSLQTQIASLMLFDDNIFSRAAAGGQAETLPPAIVEAAKKDILALLNAASLTAEELYAGYSFPVSLPPLSSLPRWETGGLPDLWKDSGFPLPDLQAYEKDREPESSLSPAPDARKDPVLAPLCRFYQAHGCGMFAQHYAFRWQDRTLIPIARPDPITLADLKRYELQRALVEQNTLAFLEKLPANNCLLYGDRGTGKSSTVKALLNALHPRGLRMVECPKESLHSFGALTEMLAELPLRFIVFIDDLSFSEGDDSFTALKGVLEGGLAARPDNMLIYATSNRRHLIKETFSSRAGDELHRSDTMQESLSLSDRFGLCVTFPAPGKQEYLDIVYTLANERGLAGDPADLARGAEQWAIERGGRSPRRARQFITALEGQGQRGLNDK